MSYAYLHSCYTERKEKEMTITGRLVGNKKVYRSRKGDKKW